MENRFNPAEHMMDLKGKKYLEVKWRLVWFREDHPDWTIHTEAIEIDDQKALFRGEILDENGRLLAVSHGSETPKDFKDYIEKAETKAVGRALAMLGYGTQFAPELEEGERIVDSPVQSSRQRQRLPDGPQGEQLQTYPQKATKQDIQSIFQAAGGKTNPVEATKICNKCMEDYGYEGSGDILKKDVPAMVEYARNLAAGMAGAEDQQKLPWEEGYR